MSQIVVTGLGCVSPFGPGVAAFSAGLRTGRPSEPPRVFDPAGYRTSGVYHAAVAGVPADSRDLPAELAERALAEACAQAGLVAGSVPEAGLVLASTSAGWHLPEETLEPGRPPLSGGTDTTALRKEGPALRLAERWRFDGPHAVLSSACASATGSLAWAGERIRNGQAPLMAVGAVDVLTEIVFAGFHSMRLLSPSTTRPFSADRSGFVLAEGAAFLIVEDEAHARARGAEVLAVLAGWGAGSDAAHITTPSADGIARSLRAALVDADLTPDLIRVYHAHGTASGASDAAEAAAVTEVFGPDAGPVVTATKSGSGHTEGAAGLFSAIAAIDAMRRAQLPPVVGVTEPDPKLGHLTLSDGAALAEPPAPALVHASGFGGVNCTVVLDRPGGTAAAPARRRARQRVLVHLAARAGQDRPVRLLGFPGAVVDPVDAGGSPRPAFARTPVPDPVTVLLGDALGAVLGAAGPDGAETARRGGLLTGTAFGGQANHARMRAAMLRAGGRAVDPMDFARSTFNVAASQCSSALGITGRLEAFIGATGGVEALLCAADCVRAGRERAVLAAAYDAPENRLWRLETDPDVPSAATALLLGTPEAVRPGSLVELADHRRLAPTTRARTAAALLAAVRRLEADGPVDEVWLDPAGLDDPVRDELAATLGSRCRPIASAAGAASPLDGHLRAMAHLTAGPPAGLIVVTTAQAAPSAVVRYQRIDRV
ncbi:beta-ketoacyl synthase N-terminal-like domain-containing protein [Kitasatospora sp. NPDC093550]|uniref:beta-ketoacyl synthase N-terminal-like domain-containing protein n=1 Tax=Kitasatospora sp. NPDC093550 TaxID=3364089 RepID=UPI003802BE2D